MILNNTSNNLIGTDQLKLLIARCGCLYALYVFTTSHPFKGSVKEIVSVSSAIP